MPAAIWHACSVHRITYSSFQLSGRTNLYVVRVHVWGTCTFACEGAGGKVRLVDGLVSSAETNNIGVEAVPSASTTPVSAKEAVEHWVGGR